MGLLNTHNYLLWIFLFRNRKYWLLKVENMTFKSGFQSDNNAAECLPYNVGPHESFAHCFFCCCANYIDYFTNYYADSQMTAVHCIRIMWQQLLRRHVELSMCEHRSKIHYSNDHQNDTSKKKKWQEKEWRMMTWFLATELPLAIRIIAVKSECKIDYSIHQRRMSSIRALFFGFLPTTKKKCLQNMKLSVRCVAAIS